MTLNDGGGGEGSGDDGRGGGGGEGSGDDGGGGGGGAATARAKTGAAATVAKVRARLGASAASAPTEAITTSHLNWSHSGDTGDTDSLTDAALDTICSCYT